MVQIYFKVDGFYKPTRPFFCFYTERAKGVVCWHPMLCKRPPQGGRQLHAHIYTPPRYQRLRAATTLYSIDGPQKGGLYHFAFWRFYNDRIMLSVVVDLGLFMLISKQISVR